MTKPRHFSNLSLAATAALSSGPVIMLDIRMTDGESVSRLPGMLDHEVAAALFRGPQYLGFDRDSFEAAVDFFNRLVEETLSRPMNLDYVIAITDGVNPPAVHSNIPGMGDPNGHPVCEYDAPSRWDVSYPSES